MELVGHEDDWLLLYCTSGRNAQVETQSQLGKDGRILERTAVLKNGLYTLVVLATLRNTNWFDLRFPQLEYVI